MNAGPGRASLASQAFWLLFAKTLGFAFTVVLPLILVRVLDQHAYGQYRQIFLLITTAGMLLPLGVPFSAFYFFPREQQRHRQIVLNIALYHLAVSTGALLLFLLYPRAIALILGSKELIAYAPAVALVLFLTVFSSITETIATAYQEIKASTVFIIFANLSKTVLLAGAVLVSRSVEAILTAAAIQGVLQSVTLLWYLQSRFPGFWKDFDRQFLLTQIRYAMPLGMSGILFWMQREAHHFYISTRFGSTAYAVYAIGCFQLPLIGLLRESIASVLISRTSEYQQQGRIADIVTLTARAMRKISLVYWPVLFFLLICAEDFIVLMFTRNYIASVPIFQVNILMLATVIPITDPIFRAFAEHRYFIVRARFALLLVLVAALQFGVNRFGMPGAVGIVLAVTLAERAIISWKSTRILGMTKAEFRLFQGSLTSGIAAAAASGPAYALRNVLDGALPIVVLLACGVVYVLVYAAALFAFGFIEQEEREMVGAAAERARMSIARVAGLR